MKKLKYYIASFRLRTLPLSVAGILLGSLLAASAGYFAWLPFSLAILTTLCLQILSNLANEWGDLEKGTDDEGRVGPIRSIQSGVLSVSEFKKIIGLFVLLSVISGTALISYAFQDLLSREGLIMLGLGGLAILAAIKYTVGKHAYGYRGLGDLFVFLFFGWLSTGGSYFILAHHLNAWIFLPASAVGFLSVGVLNINNMRDRENDLRHGKRTLPVILGIQKAKLYHTCLIFAAFVCMLVYTLHTGQGISRFLFLLTLPLFGQHLKKTYTFQGRSLDPQLRYLSVSTLLFSVLAGIGIYF